MLEINKIHNMDALEGLKQIDSDSINCCISSPPYWSLRDYKIEGQLGLEPTFEEYISKLCNIYDEVKRVLKKDGTCWVNLGDTYYSVSGNEFKEDNLSSVEKNGASGVSTGNALKKNKELKEKNLSLIPFRFAIEMQKRGWIVRNDVVWYKRNSMPSSIKDRFSNKWEHIFLFAKSKKYYFDLDSIRKPFQEGFKKRVMPNGKPFNYRVREAIRGTLQAKFGDIYSATEKEKQEYNGKYKQMNLEDAEVLGEPRAREIRKKNHNPNPNKNFGVSFPTDSINQLGGNPGDVMQLDSDFWDVTTQGHPFAHFAVYPERLIEPMVKAGCHRDGIVLDPFMGSGTTAVVAKRLGRKYIGFELNPDYIKICNKRLSEVEIPLNVGL